MIMNYELWIGPLINKGVFKLYKTPRFPPYLIFGVSEFPDFRFSHHEKHLGIMPVFREKSRFCDIFAPFLSEKRLKIL